MKFKVMLHLAATEMCIMYLFHLYVPLLEVPCSKLKRVAISKYFNLFISYTCYNPGFNINNSHSIFITIFEHSIETNFSSGQPSFAISLFPQLKPCGMSTVQLHSSENWAKIEFSS